MECITFVIFLGLIFLAVYFQVRLNRLGRRTTEEISALKAQVHALQGRLHGSLGEADQAQAQQPLPGAPGTILLPPQPAAAASPPPTPAPITDKPPAPVPVARPAPLAPQPATRLQGITPPPTARPTPQPVMSQPVAQPDLPPRAPSKTLAEMGELISDQFDQLSAQNPFLRWFLGAHLIVRVGIVILFIGIAFLLRYAADQGWFPIELRLAGAAALGAGLVGVGWWLRAKRRVYALTLQGGGLGIIYLTTFVAYRLYELLPPAVAFPILVLLGVAAATMAVLTDALSLALLAMAGAFAAPLLVDTGSDNVVAFFAYLTVVNAAILGIAWFRAWRVLNLVGFVATALLGTLWGLDAFTPAHLPQVQPFVALFLLFYVTIGLHFASRQPPKLLGLVDGPLVIGTPLVVVSWQALMLQSTPYGLAISLAAMGGLYLALTAILTTWSPAHYAGLRECYLVIGTLALTLAVPTGFDNRLTVAIWAVGGAGLVALGLRQGRMFHVGWGLAMQAYAGIVHASLLNPDWLGIDRAFVTPDLSSPPLTNALWVGSMLLVVAGAVTAYLARQQAARVDDAAQSQAWRTGHTVLALWAMAWWYIGGAHELGRVLAVDGPLAANQAWSQALLAFFTLSALLGEGLNRRFGWPVLRLAATLLWLPTTLIGAQLARAGLLYIDEWTTLVLWPAIILIHIASLRRTDPPIPHAVINHLGIAALTTVLIWSMDLTPGVVVFALGGAALAILGMRQARPFRIVWGAVMQSFAVWLHSHVVWDWLVRDEWAVWGWRDPLVVGYLALAVAALATAYAALRLAPRMQAQKLSGVGDIVHLLFSLWGLAWCYVLGADWVLRGSTALVASDWVTIPQLLAGVVVVIGGLGELLTRPLRWPILRITGVGSPLLVAPLALIAATTASPLLAGLGWLICPAALALYYVALYRLERANILSELAPLLQVVGLWYLAGFGTLDMLARAAAWDGAGSGWTSAAWAVVPALLVLLLCTVGRFIAWPVRRYEGALVEAGALVLNLGLIVWTVLVSLTEAGDSAPLAFTPVLNPVDLTQLLVLGALGAWLLRLKARGSKLFPTSWNWVIFPLFALITVNAILARAAYHLWGTDYSVGGWLDDALLQAVYSVIWSATALACMVVAARQKRRPLWLLGAALLGLTVVKLLLLDMSGADTLARIVSFIVVGLLMLLVGYFAPIPPRKPAVALPEPTEIPTPS